MPREKENEAQKELQLRRAKNLGMGHPGWRGNDLEGRWRQCGGALGRPEDLYMGNTAS